MKNIILDLMMGVLCVVLVVTFVGISIIPDVVEEWRKMRTV